MEKTKTVCDWYSNKEIFEMMTDLKENMNCLSLEIKETKTLIRDYNNLRGTIGKHTSQINALEQVTQKLNESKREYIGYILATISTIFMLLNYLR